MQDREASDGVLTTNTNTTNTATRIGSLRPNQIQTQTFANQIARQLLITSRRNLESERKLCTIFGTMCPASATTSLDLPVWRPFACRCGLHREAQPQISATITTMCSGVDFP